MLQPIHQQRILPAKVTEQYLPAITVDTTEIHKLINQMYNKTIILPATHTVEVSNFVQTPQGIVPQNSLPQQAPKVAPVEAVVPVPQTTPVVPVNPAPQVGPVTAVVPVSPVPQTTPVVPVNPAPQVGPVTAVVPVSPVPQTTPVVPVNPAPQVGPVIAVVPVSPVPQVVPIAPKPTVPVAAIPQVPPIQQVVPVQVTPVVPAVSVTQIVPIDQVPPVVPVPVAQVIQVTPSQVAPIPQASQIIPNGSLIQPAIIPQFQKLSVQPITSLSINSGIAQIPKNPQASVNSSNKLFQPVIPNVNNSQMLTPQPLIQQSILVQ